MDETVINSMKTISPVNGDLDTLYDGVSIKVEPIYLEHETREENACDDDMRHFDQPAPDQHHNHGQEEQNAEQRNQTGHSIQERGLRCTPSSGRCQGKGPTINDDTESYDDEFTRESDGFGSCIPNNELSEAVALEKDVTSLDSTSSNEVKLLSPNGCDYESGSQTRVSLAYETLNADFEHTVDSSERARPHLHGAYSTLGYNRVRPVGKSNANCVLLTSTRGYIMLLANNYRYGKERNRGNRHYWRCRVRGCHGRAVTVCNQFHQHSLVSASMHSHPPPDYCLEASETGSAMKISESSPHETLFGNSEDVSDKGLKLDESEKVDDEVFVNVEEELPVFVDDVSTNEPRVFQSKIDVKEEEICRTVLPKRGRLTLIARNFMYGRDRCRNDRHYWRCRIRQCHGRAVTKYDKNGNHVLVACTPHSHSPSDYPESVMTEALEAQQKHSNESITRDERQMDDHGHGNISETTNNILPRENVVSPGIPSDAEMGYQELEGLKESITIVHPKEVSEDSSVPLPRVTTPLTGSMFRGSHLDKTRISSVARLPSSSPELEDGGVQPLSVARHQNGNSMAPEWHGPRFVYPESVDFYEHWSDNDCPVGDENCMCAVSPHGRPQLYSHPMKNHNHAQVCGSPGGKEYSAQCRLVKSHSGVCYLMANKYAHLKDNIQREKHFWKCHFRHCNGQAVTKLVKNIHTLIDFVPHHHPPMQAHLEEIGIFDYEIGNSQHEPGYNGTRELPSFIDLNSEAAITKETEPLEICSHVLSRRGKHILLARGYSFGIERNRNDRYYWRCKIRGCRGRAVTKILADGKHALIHFATHMHPPLANQHLCASESASDDQHYTSIHKPLADVDNHHNREDSDGFVNTSHPHRHILGAIHEPCSLKHGPCHLRRMENASRYSVSETEENRPRKCGDIDLQQTFPSICNGGESFHKHQSGDTLFPSNVNLSYGEPHMKHRGQDAVGCRSVEPKHLKHRDIYKQTGRYVRSVSPNFCRGDNERCTFRQDANDDNLHQSACSPVVEMNMEAHTSERWKLLKRNFNNSDNAVVYGERKKQKMDLPEKISHIYEMKLGDKVIEGKTKIVYALPEYKDGSYVLLESKDRITCGDGARADTMEGKAALSTSTTSSIFELLNQVGIKTHFAQKYSDTKFIAQHCEMIPLEFVTRRIATGSFLKRNVGVKEGYRFAPPILETFFKDDANHDPQWSREQCIEAGLTHGGVTIGRRELDIMGDTAIAVFEILEKAWAYQNCVLVDMKVEFGINPKTKAILLADVIDNDSWRLWPAGDKRLMRDKQVYRNLREVTPQAMEEIKKNYKWVAEQCEKLICKPNGRVAIFMGSSSDKEHGQKIQKYLEQYGVPSDLRVTSAHKGTEETLKVLRWYESHGVPTVFVAIAGRSNGLGPVLSGNTAYPVINCPPVKADWGTSDIWSSLRLPSGLGCTTVIDPQGAALAAAQIIGMHDHMVWGTMRAHRLTNMVNLMKADGEICL